MRDDIDLWEGAITGAGFEAGDAVVVGTWARSPIGRVVDVMWRTHEGRTILLAPSQVAAGYIAGLYRFDEVRVVGVRGGIRGDEVDVVAGPLHLSARIGSGGWQSWLFALRPRALRRSPTWITVEDRVLRPLVAPLIGGADGVRAAGVAPGGQQEWYGVDDRRPVVSARLSVDGVDRGGLTSLPADFGVGLSAFPTAPASVRVGTMVGARR